MTDAQLLTLAIAIIVPLSLLLYSNGRITDAKETLRAEIGESKQTLCLEMQTLHGEIQTLHGEMQISNNRITETNNRIADAKETLRAEIGETKQALRGEMQTLRGDMQLGFERILNKLDHLAGEVATMKEQMPTHLREYHNVK